MRNLLQESKDKLEKPLFDARRKLLIILNSVYIVLVPIYLLSEKSATGKFVNDPVMYWVYGSAILLNICSLYYNIRIFLINRTEAYKVRTVRNLFIYQNKNRLDILFGYASILPLLIQSICNMTGVGNPSSDAILTDFSLASSLMIGVVIIMGRKAVVIWFVLVMSILFWDVQSRGWDYEFHYSTPAEVAKYKTGLANNESWALQRKLELSNAKLNPPKITRYFNTWFVFIIVAFMAAYYFSGITLDIIELVPSVVSNIGTAIEDDKVKDLELEHKQKEITKSAMRIVRYNEILEDLNKQIEGLDYKDKKNLIGIISSLRKALGKETDWENFQTNFDSVHNDFFKIVQNKFPNLSHGDLKHLAYIRMNLSSSEISRLMDVQKDSLRVLRSRLKKKLNLTEDIDLRDFTCNIELIE